MLAIIAACFMQKLHATVVHETTALDQVLLTVLGRFVYLVRRGAGSSVVAVVEMNAR